MSFSSSIKKEILFKAEKACCEEASLYAFILFKAEISDNLISFKRLRKSFIKRIKDLVASVFNSQLVFDTNYYYIKDSYDVLKHYNIDQKRDIDLTNCKLECCINSFISTSFLTRGSINDPNKQSYHLEIVFDTFKQALTIKDLLLKRDIDGKIIERTKGFVYYVKKAEQIGDFIKIVEAFNSLFEYEDARIKKDLGNMVNRINNCDITNATRAYKSAMEQIEYIKTIEENQGYGSLSARLMEAIILRNNYPDASLQELSELSFEAVGVNVSKSSLNHRFRELKELASKYINKDIAE